MNDKNKGKKINLSISKTRKKNNHVKQNNITKHNIKLRKNKKGNSKKRTSKKETTKHQKNNKSRKNQKGGSKETPRKEEFLFNLPVNTSHDESMISYKDKSFDNNLFTRESHNCYTYFLNLKSKSALELCKKDFKKHNMCRRAQPGYFHGHPTLQKSDYNCPNIMKRTLDDNPQIYKINSMHDKCDPRFYKGALVVAPGRDYHYYRQDDDNNGLWSHKPGYKPSTIRDSKNNLIVDPKAANRDYGETLNYKDFCGYLCVPRNGKRKFMAHKGEEIDKTSHNKYRAILNKHNNGTSKKTNIANPPNQQNKFETLAQKVVNKIK